MKSVFGDCGVRTKSHPVEPHHCMLCFLYKRCRASTVSSGFRQSATCGVEPAASGRGNSADAKLSRGLRAPRARWHVIMESAAIFVLTLIPNAQDSNAQDSSKRHQADWGSYSEPVRQPWYGTRGQKAYINSNTAPQWAMPKHQH